MGEISANMIYIVIPYRKTFQGKLGKQQIIMCCIVDFTNVFCEVGNLAEKL